MEEAAAPEWQNSHSPTTNKKALRRKIMCLRTKFSRLKNINTSREESSFNPAATSKLIIIQALGGSAMASRYATV